MRAIKFRGQERRTGIWVYGGFVQRTTGDVQIAVNRMTYTRFIGVVPDSVGQFTGFRDCNGVGIYEGDIVRLYVGNDRDSFENDEVVFDKGCWVLKRLDLINGNDRKFLYVKVAFPANIEVIGNVHDNPEFVKGE